MFLGEYQHAIDEKGRMTVPARFRQLLAEGGYVTQGFDRNLMVLQEGSFEAMSRRVRRMSVTHSNARELRRAIFGRAQHFELDKSGRILLPQFLRESAQLDGDAVLVGVGDYFEIWTPENWAEQDEKLKAAQDNAEYFSELELFADED